MLRRYARYQQFRKFFKLSYVTRQKSFKSFKFSSFWWRMPVIFQPPSALDLELRRRPSQFSTENCLLSVLGGWEITIVSCRAEPQIRVAHRSAKVMEL